MFLAKFYPLVHSSAFNYAEHVTRQCYAFPVSTYHAHEINLYTVMILLSEGLETG